MPQRQTVEAFVAMVEDGRFVDAYRRFYDQNASAQENQQPPRLGQDALVANEERVLRTFRTVRGRADRVLVDGDHVVINWRFEFETADGLTLRLDELAHQVWSGETIVAERFYYDPAQMQPPATGV